MNKSLEDKLVVFLDEVGIEDIPYVGGKNASLGEMIRHLKPKGVNVPYGFVVTAEAYRYFVKHNNLEQKIKDTLKDIAKKDTDIRVLYGGSVNPQNAKEFLKAPNVDGLLVGGACQKRACCKRDDKSRGISARLGR